MSNQDAWNAEYTKGAFLTNGVVASKGVRDFVKHLRRKESLDIGSLVVLDAGCGTGKNAFYFSEFGAKVLAYDLSSVAIDNARKYAKENGIPVEFTCLASGKLPYEDKSVDVLVDSMSIHLLTEEQRQIYAAEVSRVLKDTSYIYLKTFKLEGDANAKQLIKDNVRYTGYSYILPVLSVEERVFTLSEVKELFGSSFAPFYIHSDSGYMRFGERTYKRNYYTVYYVRRDNIS